MNILISAEVYCGPPNKIQNGGIKSATGVTYGKVATYFCNGGFEMKPDPKNPNATCEETGKWSNVPSCTCKFIVIHYNY